MKLAPLLLVLLLATAGCIELTDPNAATNTTTEDDPVLPDLTVTFLTNWLPDRYHYLLKVNATTLPEGFRVDVTTANETESFPASDLTQRLGTSYDIPTTRTPQPGDEVTLEAFIGDTSIASRSILVDDGSVETAEGLEVHVTYDAMFEETDTTADEPRSLRLDMTMVGDFTAARQVMTTTGDGSANFSDESMTMTMTMDLDAREVDGDLESQVLQMDGTWSMGGEEGTGSGTVTGTETFVRYGTKAVGGETVDVEVVDKTMTMDGTFTFSGVEATMHMVNDTREYRDRESGVAVWIESSETMSMTMFGDTSTDETQYDGPPAEEDAEVSISDAAAWSGVNPVPMVPGDKVRLEGLEGLVLDIVVKDGGEATYAGQSFETVRAEGVVSGGGASGSTTWVLVADGVLGGMPLSMTGEATRATESFRMELTLRSVS